MNKEMIDWDRKHFPGIHFSPIEKEISLPYPAEHFHLIYAFSVFTHIPVDEVSKWISELSRVTSPKGLLLITTHGEKFNDTLSKNDLSLLFKNGSFTQSYFQKGHRMITSYWQKKQFEKNLESDFKVLEYYDGTSFPQKAGGQDLWILQKKSAE
jgi:ubiquinone/menaquinone biosynthesis C-methylase UbiE